jgi:hypothetical protein
MNGRATESGGASRRDGRVSHFMKAPVAVALLREQYGEADARKIALTGAAQGEAGAIEEALRILGRGGGADRERESQ